MKRGLLTILLLAFTSYIYSQTIYYWVGSSPSASNANINNNANWNTDINGGGSGRTSSTTATDILIFDGSNLGGTSPVTGPVLINANSSITCAQLKFVNNAMISMVRPTGGTSTITIAGEAGDDFIVEAGSSMSIPVSTLGSLRFTMAAANTAVVGGSISVITTQQFRFENSTSGNPNSFRFLSGSSFTTNITSSSSSYAFGSSSQSSPYWVTFEAGSDLYFNGGYSPHGSGTLFSAIDMQPGSNWHHRATTANTGGGNFFNRQSYGNIIVENNGELIASGSIYRIQNLTVNSGCSFTTHSSGQTVVLGNLVVDGTLTSGGSGSNELVLAGNTAQTISGSGSISVASLLVNDNADVTISKDITVDANANIYGKINFNTYKLSGAANFAAIGTSPNTSATGDLVAGSYMITGNSGIISGSQGLAISGAGVAPNTSIVSFSTTGDSIYLSTPLTGSGTAVALTVSGEGATLQNNNTNGYDPATGTISLTGNQTFDDNINYIINGATTWPFGVTTGTSATPINAKFVEINAPVTVNKGLTLSDHLSVNAKITLRPADLLHLLSGAVLNGSFGAASYIATDANATTGEQGSLQIDGLSSSMTMPIGTVNYYLPVTLNPASSSDFSVSVFEGITDNGLVNGNALTPSQKQTVVNAVWNINRLSGTGNADMQIDWDAALEGSTFTTLPDTDIGLIANMGSSWGAPFGTSNNTLNTATSNIGTFGAFSIGAVPQVDPFVFNAIPTKVYGDVDFNGGATSLNATQPIVYSSSDPAVATIVSGNIHITGAGTATITASQASDGFYPAASVDQTLTVDKAALTIKADDQLKFEGQPNPTLTITYTGFVYGETATVLLMPPVITTTATAASAPGTYPISVSGATAANYTITFVNGTMTVQAKQNQTITFNALPTKNYGAADFTATATSTNSTIPITYSSSDPSVATINSGGIVHITGGGTTTITASQAGNAGYFPATDVARTFTVNKVALTIRVLDTVKNQGQVNPDFTITYTGFVLGETAANLATPPSVSTIATTNSTAGNYSLTPQGAVTSNYNITYVSGILTILPSGGTDKNYIHAFMNSNTSLTVRVFSTFPALSDITLYDMNGKPLLKKNVFLPEGFIDSKVDISKIPSGVYIVTVKGSGVDLKKMIPIIR